MSGTHAGGIPGRPPQPHIHTALEGAAHDFDSPALYPLTSEDRQTVVAITIANV
jgi:hypothetical protein